LIRYANKKDPAFGLVAETLAKGVTTKLETATKEAAKTPAKAPAKKPAAKKPAAKKTSGGGGDASAQQIL
jgi:topoisomerase IA-like protein